MNSTVGRSCKLDYAITFSDAQDLERVRRKLLKAGLILASTADIARSLNTHIKEISEVFELDEVAYSIAVFDQYAASLEMHARIVKMLLNKLNGTTKLVYYAY